MFHKRNSQSAVGKGKKKKEFPEKSEEMQNKVKKVNG